MPRPSGIIRYLIVALILLTFFYIFSNHAREITVPKLTNPAFTKPFGDLADSNPGANLDSGIGSPHPIDKLIFDAQDKFDKLLAKETKTVQDAAQAYRKRRGRHPPPDFDKWFEFAQSHNAVVVEDFFDQIYHDLEPFWGQSDAAAMRRESAGFEMTINIRNGNATTTSDWFWTVIWLNLIKKIEHLLPDMDIALNPMDEPRIIAEYEVIEKYMQKAAQTVQLHDPQKVINKFQTMPKPGANKPKVSPKVWEEKDNKTFWNLVRRGCPPTSLARTEPVQTDFDRAPVFNVTNAEAHSYEGYVSNSSLSSNICHQPDLQGLEGVFIEPLSTSTTNTLFPLFGGSKLSVNNEILIPAAMYYNDEKRFTGGDNHGAEWATKMTKVIWRGVATGGLNRDTTWRGFQRHRFVAMNNVTKLKLAESGAAKPENFALPDKSYGIKAQQEGKLGEWVGKLTNVGLTDLNCMPAQEDHKCYYTDHAFELVNGMDLTDQFNSKFLPDVDGNSFSGRYIGFLRSTSLPIKSTVWREWHDDRLIAWKHFVPMDNRFTDYYGILNYFAGYNGRGAHDSAAKKIATEGKEWAEKVLRKEDMEIYVLRLLLEYARLLDDRRESMGWVKDVLANPSSKDE